MPVGAALGFVLPVALGLRPMLYFHLAWSALFPVRTKQSLCRSSGGKESPRFLSLTFFFFQAAPATPPSPTRKHHEARRGENLSWVTVLPYFRAGIRRSDPRTISEQSQKGWLKGFRAHG